HACFFQLLHDGLAVGGGPKRGAPGSRRTANRADEKTGWPQASGIFRGAVSSVPSRRVRNVTSRAATLVPIQSGSSIISAGSGKVKAFCGDFERITAGFPQKPAYP